MRIRAGRKLGHLAAAGVLAGVMLCWAPPGAAFAVSFTKVPERLYMSPDGTTLIAALIGVPVGTMPFDGGTDIISQDVRTIEVAATDGPLGCDLTDQPDPMPDFDVDDCSRVQLSVSHGIMSMGTVTTNLFRDYITDPDGPGPLDSGDDNPNDPVYQYPGGAVLEGFGGAGDPNNPNDPNGFRTLGVNGTQAQLNDALSHLVYTPDDDYYYVGSNPETLTISLISGDPADPDSPVTKDVQIRVLDVNDFPSHDGPDNKVATPELELEMNSEFTAADEDNDESVDDDTGQTLPDGENQDMLLIGWLQCGQTIAPNTGFHFQGGTFQSDNVTIDDFLLDIYDPTSNMYYQQVVDAILAGLDLIDPNLRNVEIATSSPFVYTEAFAGVSDMATVQYALDQVTFLHNVPNDDCTLLTVVSDLGNNGLPVQYVGSPSPPFPDPPGIEIPFLGFDFNVLDIHTTDYQQVDASFVPGSIFTGEPGTATATVAITPPIHPAFDLRWSNSDGTATVVDGDYPSITDASVHVPEDAPTVTIDAQAYGDGNPEGNENFTLTLTTPTDPPPGAFTRPYGWEVNSANPLQNVIILDEDDAARTITSVSDPSVLEGDSGQATLQFTLTLDGPADGDETVDVATNDGSATVANNDYDEITTQTVTFAPGATTATVNVTVNGDTTDEPNETLTLDLSGEANVTVGDSSGTGTILNDDATRHVTAVSDPIVVEGDSGTKTMTFTITLDIGAKGTETVQADTADGSATTANNDYDPVSQLVTFAPGATTANVVVTINGDTTDEPDENLTLDLTAPNLLVLDDSSGTGTIQNDDATRHVLSVTDPSVTEGNAGTKLMTFTINLDNPAKGTESVRANTADGTATTANNDYASVVDQIVTFPLGANSANVTVTINGDTSPETDETLTLQLDLPANLILDDPSGLGTITDDDTVVDVTPPTVTINQGAAQVDPTTVSPIVFDVVFSEPVTGFATGDVALSGTAGATTALVSGSGATYTVSVSGMTMDGTVIASIPAGVAIDAASNPNDASTSSDNQVTFDFDEGDVTAPTVTINQGAAQTDPTSTPPIVFDVVFSEAVTGFTGTDVGLSGTAGATTAVVSGSGAAYTVSVTGMSASGTVIATITAGAAADAANNLSAASTSTDNQVTFDVSKQLIPITLNVPANITVNNAPGLAGANVNYPAVTASGGVPPLTVACNRASGEFYPLGVTTVTCTATDSAGGGQQAQLLIEAVQTGTFTITVLDVEPPVIAPLPNLVRETQGTNPVSVTFTFPTATDNSGVAPTVTCTRPATSSYAVGVATVTCTATDGAGNQASTSFTVTVISTPVLVPLPITGSDVGAIVLLAFACVGGGLLLARFARRRRTT